MQRGLSRRSCLAIGAAGTLAAWARQPVSAFPEIPIRNGIPQVDYHAHPSPAISVERAIEISKQRGVTFGLVQHAGTREENRYSGLVSNDDELRAWIRTLDGKPVFRGIQAELNNWVRCFSKDALVQLDYILSDALTMPGPGGRWIHIWTREFECDDANKWMDRYADYHVEIMAKGPMDIIANPTYLPDLLAPRFDELWTVKRMRTVIDAAVKYGVAVEINSRFRVPRLPFLKMAKAAGLKFSFGSNMQTPDRIGDIGYGEEMYRTLGLTAEHFWRPAPIGRKPVQIRTLA